MPLGLVFIQHGAHALEKLLVFAFQPFRYVFMYRCREREGFSAEIFTIL